MKHALRLVPYALVRAALCVAISRTFVRRWIADVVTPPGRDWWVGMGGLLYIVAVAVLMVVVLVALWLVGRQFDPIARWFGPLVRRFRRRGGWPWRR